MGRPRKKRKYTRRTPLAVNGSIANVDAAKLLTAKIRAQIMDAPVDVAKVAVMDLLSDLQWMAKVYEDTTAPGALGGN